MDENWTKNTPFSRRFGRNWVFHLIFCVGFAYVFTHMSVMRPLIPHPAYLEYACAAFVLLFLYLHYCFLIPKFLLQRKYTQYVVMAIVTALVWSCCEVGFLKPYLDKYFYAKVPVPFQTGLFVQDIAAIFMRNIATLSIYILFGLYEKAVSEEKNMKAVSANQLHLLRVKDNQKEDCFIEIPQLLYCRQDRNYTHYFTRDGEYTTLTTLKEIKELIGEDCVQVGRNLLIMRQAILEENSEYVTLHNPSDPENPIIISVK